MNIPPRIRLLLEIWWLLLSLALIVIGWMNYNEGRGNWYLILAIFGAVFFLYTIGSAVYYWRFHQHKRTR